MKNFLLLILCLLFSPSVLAFGGRLDASTIQVHDMQMINQQKFRIEEYNDYKEMQEEKERYNREHTPAKPLVNRLFNKQSDFVEENGEIKIKYQEN